MCGRYAASRRPEDLVEEFEIDPDSAPFGGPAAEDQPDQLDRRPGVEVVEAPGRPGAGWNVAPTRVAPVVLERPAHRERPDEPPDEQPVRLLRGLTWGLVPSWAKERSVGQRMINARAETLLEKPAYRRAALARRCLVPADGWFEWQPSPTATDARGKPRKQPFYMHPLDGRVIAFAGVYELWRDPTRPDGDPAAWLASYAVLTTAAEPGLAAVHDRMPLVLPPAAWDDWLDPAVRDRERVQELLQPAPPGRFAATPVTTRVNAVRNDGPELLEPVPEKDLAGVVDPATGELYGPSGEQLF